MSVRPIVIVASPDRNEVALLSEWLSSEGLEPLAARSLQAAIHEVQSRTYDVLIADAAFAFDGELQRVARNHNARAPLVVVGGDAGTRARAERNGTFHVGRPVDQTVLLCHVAMAIAEGRPARRSERKRITPFEAVVEGRHAYIIDISNEGLRLALPRQRCAPPPQFAFRIPLIGVALTVRRVWMSAAPVEQSDGAWCGVELYQPSSRAEQSWRTFVSTVSGR
jgi:CheY-like chemotaxis protein